MTALARISRISFATDMTKGGSPEIPLGYMLEAAWTDQARWLGLIGRTRLTTSELKRVNLHTWPELEKPFSLLSRLFDQGWDCTWGDAGAAIECQWASSALCINTSDALRMVEDASAGTDVEWATTTVLLEAHLTQFGARLVPTLEDFKKESAKPIAKPRPAFSHVAPKARRMQEDFAHIAIGA